MTTLWCILNGLHAAGYNSAENEPIWMKFGKLSAKCWGLATADFGRDPRSSHSLRGMSRLALRWFLLVHWLARVHFIRVTTRRVDSVADAVIHHANVLCQRGSHPRRHALLNIQCVRCRRKTTVRFTSVSKSTFDSL